MEKEIVYTEEYALILNDERIEDVRPHKGKFHLEQGSIINQFPTYLTDLTECKLIIAHLPLSDAPILEGVPLLPSFSWGQLDDIDSLIDKKAESNNTIDLNAYGNGCADGYSKAKEKYKYTEEDVRKAISLTRDGVLGADEIIQSLQQPSRPTHFEYEECQELCLNCEWQHDSCPNAEDCLKPKPKTITNSQGNIELAGKYI